MENPNICSFVIWPIVFQVGNNYIVVHVLSNLHIEYATNKYAKIKQFYGDYIWLEVYLLRR